MLYSNKYIFKIMAKAKSSFVCQQCSYSQTGWFGKCPECGAWNSAVETLTEKVSNAKGKKRTKKKTTSIALSDIQAKTTKRIPTKITELDRVFGGGLVLGQVVLLAGEPGIGKSTILMQVSEKLSSGKKQVLYVSGEESSSQLKIRADRLGVKGEGVKLLEKTNIDEILEEARESKNSLIIIDSIQTMFTNDLRGMAGSVGQVRECAYRLVRHAKSTRTPIIIVGHVTKQGSVAGPSLLMHIVDTVLWFEGGRDMAVRIIRSRKNRFGSTDEVGIFSMTDKGLISIDDANNLFVSSETKNIAGSAITSVLEGTRPVLVEIQSLVVPTRLAYPRRTAQGIDSKKLEVILAVLQRRAGLKIDSMDVYTNVVGGLKIKEPGADLAIAMSIASSYFEKGLPKKSIWTGEVGLLGEIRQVARQEKRIKEAKRLGYKNAYTNKKLKFIRDAIRSAFDK